MRSTCQTKTLVKCAISCIFCGLPSWLVVLLWVSGGHLQQVMKGRDSQTQPMWWQSEASSSIRCSLDTTNDAEGQEEMDDARPLLVLILLNAWRQPITSRLEKSTSSPPHKQQPSPSQSQLASSTATDNQTDPSQFHTPIIVSTHVSPIHIRGNSPGCNPPSQTPHQSVPSPTPPPSCTCSFGS